MSSTAYRHIDLSQQIALQRQYLANMEANLFSCDQDEAAAQALLASDEQDIQTEGQRLLQNVNLRRRQVEIARKVGEKKLDELVKLSRMSERVTERVSKPTRSERRNGNTSQLVPVD